MAREAYSHEVSSAGFWPGGGPVAEPNFYSYAYPARPASPPPRSALGQARFSAALGEFLLPYAAVRAAPDPDAALMAFLQSTYETAANAAKWDRASLECEVGEVGKPRKV